MGLGVTERVTVATRSFYLLLISRFHPTGPEYNTSSIISPSPVFIMATNTTNVTDASYANLLPREKGLFILSQVTCVADEANAINPENVRHGFVITGFAPPVNA